MLYAMTLIAYGTGIVIATVSLAMAILRCCEYAASALRRWLLAPYHSKRKTRQAQEREHKRRKLIVLASGPTSAPIRTFVADDQPDAETIRRN